MATVDEQSTVQTTVDDSAQSSDHLTNTPWADVMKRHHDEDNENGWKPGVIERITDWLQETVILNIPWLFPPNKHVQAADREREEQEHAYRAKREREEAGRA